MRGETAKPRNRNLSGEAKSPQEEKQDAKESGITSCERGDCKAAEQESQQRSKVAPGRKAGRERVRRYILGEGEDCKAAE